MTTVLVFPSVLGVRDGIHDTVTVLAAAGHDAVVVDVLEGRTFEEYDDAIAHARTLDDDHRHGLVEQAMATVTGPFATVGFSSGCELAEWAAAQRPGDARGVVLVGGAIPMHWVGVPWPAGVPAQTHACEADPFDDGPEAAAEFRRDVEAAGGRVEVFTYPGTGHLFNEPGLADEFDPGSAASFYDRLTSFVSG